MHDDEVEEVLAMLAAPEARDRVLMLQAITDPPTGSARLTHALETLTEDTAVTVLTIPYTFGEVRWAAARALAAVRRAQGPGDPVLLTGVPAPLGVEAVIALAAEHGIGTGGGVEGLIAAYVELRDRGLVPTTDLRP